MKAEECFLVTDAPHSGAYNMAADEWCAAWAARQKAPVLRLYQWEPATLSLGYFQDLADRTQHTASSDCPVVRRPSGGGAIVHDLEWTYALCLPANHPLGKDRLRLYMEVHRTLVVWLQHQGVRAWILRSGADGVGCDRASQASCPFLCFQRRTPGDILAEFQDTEGTAQGNLMAGTNQPSLVCRDGPTKTIKLVGSAQRRTRQAILQHGSILLGRSPYAPELLGVWEVLGHQEPLSRRDPLFQQLAVTWPVLLAETFAWRLVPLGESWEDDPLFRELLGKFSSEEWTTKHHGQRPAEGA